VYTCFFELHSTRVPNHPRITSSSVWTPTFCGQILRKDFKMCGKLGTTGYSFSETKSHFVRLHRNHARIMSHIYRAITRDVYMCLSSKTQPSNTTKLGPNKPERKKLLYRRVASVQGRASLGHVHGDFWIDLDFQFFPPVIQLGIRHFSFVFFRFGKYPT